MTDVSMPALLFYCQHSLGIGHLTRSFALAEALSKRFRVVFLNGGRLPPGVRAPASIERIDLPPLGMDDGHTVVSRDTGMNVDDARARRTQMILDAVEMTQPAVLVVELFPFGRKKFTAEVLPMIWAARDLANGPALIACSLRDILVDARPDQQRHDDRARWIADRYFDAVLVHSDPAFARLQDSFRPARPMRAPVYHTGYVVPAREYSGSVKRGDHLLVSAGGGIVGGELFRAMLAARVHLKYAIPLRIVAGPFLPEPEWQALQRAASVLENVELVRHVPDMVAEMRAARASVSQCGYNTALDIAVAGVPALVVPYETATENEQRTRADRLAAAGAVQTIAAGELATATLAQAIERLLAFTPTSAALALDGAEETAQTLEQLLGVRSRHPAIANTGKLPCLTF